jgi:hypothetical protein
MSFGRGNKRRIVGWFVALAVVATASVASAYTLKPLYDFCAQQNCPDGANPTGTLLMDSSGNLFGTTSSGGTGNGPDGPAGTVFELTPDRHGGWTEHVLHSFCVEPNCTDGTFPHGQLIMDAAGNLYGTAEGVTDSYDCYQSGLCGFVYELTPNDRRTKWKFRIVYRFCHNKLPDCKDGALPVSGLNYAGAASGAPYDGVSPLYAATVAGGSRLAGALVELIPGKHKWSESVIHDFCLGLDCFDEAAANLFVDATGDVYGAADSRKWEGEGSVFQLNPDAGTKRWTKVTLRKFCAPRGENCLRGGMPNAPSVRDAKGNFFGTTFEGGKWSNPNFLCSDFNPTGGCGVLYRLIPDGEQSNEKVLYDFCSQDNCTDGAFPDAHLSMDSSGNLFGTTLYSGVCGLSCAGVVFRFGNDGYHVLYNFCSEANCTDGNQPVGGVILDGAGNLFGAAAGGGQHKAGRIFELVP